MRCRRACEWDFGKISTRVAFFSRLIELGAISINLAHLITYLIELDYPWLNDGITLLISLKDTDGIRPKWHHIRPLTITTTFPLRNAILQGIENELLKEYFTHWIREMWKLFRIESKPEAASFINSIIQSVKLSLHDTHNLITSCVHLLK